MDEPITLRNELLEAKISPRVGASLYSLRFRLAEGWVDVCRPTAPTALAENKPGEFASFNMIPYSNRIEHGRLTYKGKTYQINVNNADGHAIHGDVRDKPWQVREVNARKLALEFRSNWYEDISWPFPFATGIQFSLEADSLHMDMSVRNLSGDVAPVGMGIHPYFRRQLTDKDDVVLAEIPVIGVYPGTTPIPTGHWVETPDTIDFSQKKILPEDFLDKCFRAADKPFVLEWPQSGVRLTMIKDSLFRHVIIFCPQDKPGFFAVEPVTNCNNAFNMAEEGVDDTGTIYLKPGQEISGRITLQLAQV